MAGLLTELITLEKPALEPLDLEDVVAYIHSSPREESFVRTLIPLVREMLEGKLGVAFYTQKVRSTFEFPAFPVNSLVTDRWDDEMVVTLPKPPIQVLQKVEVETDLEDFVEITDEEYQAIVQFPVDVYLYGGAFSGVDYPWWTSLQRRPRVRCTYTCGWNTVDSIPAKYKMMLYQAIAYNFLQREVGGWPDTFDKAVLAEKIFVL